MLTHETNMPDHLFVSDCDGGLYDTRPNANVAEGLGSLLRPNYRRSHRGMKNLNDVKATLRAGKYAWPGGYPMYFITADGGVLSFEAAQAEFHQVAWDWLHNGNTGWRIVGCEINYEDTNLICDHTNEPIEAAFT